jgi:lipopolysaccharide/colanic/teichoic acid biosynthesis glycosyltransferase
VSMNKRRIDLLLPGSESPLVLNQGDALCGCHNVLGFFPQEHFKDMLSRERMRTERSKKPFILVLIDIEKLLKDSSKKRRLKLSGAIAVTKVIEALSEVSREIDIRGWYEYAKSIGVIYTEISELSADIILRRIKDVLQVTLGHSFTYVEVLVVKFPIDKDGDEQGVSLNSFYPRKVKEGSESTLFFSFKRLIDITGSLIGITIFSPVFLIVPLLIKITSRGPVFFRQKRVGYGGEIFTFYKFRSMYVNNDDSIHKAYVTGLIKGQVQREENGVFKIKDDPRVTSIGRILRKTSLDELPQFFNVLKGDMSLVGPRPPIPYETDQYDLWHLRRVLECKPGVTGYWQVEGRSQTTFDGMVRMDIRYMKKKSVLFDLRLIFKTPWALFTAKGAY